MQGGHKPHPAGTAFLYSLYIPLTGQLIAKNDLRPQTAQGMQDPFRLWHIGQHIAVQRLGALGAGCRDGEQLSPLINHHCAPAQAAEKGCRASQKGGFAAARGAHQQQIQRLPCQQGA